jgi:hypothetical protein
LFHGLIGPDARRPAFSLLSGETLDVQSRFSALPAYLRGKRRLCPIIFAALARVVPRERWPGLRFLDAFLGGGSVSLFAKAHALSVGCNDLALRSVIVGRALIENGTVRLTHADVAQLLKTPEGAYPHLAEKAFCPAVFPEMHARLLDRALYQARTSLTGAKRDLALLLLVKWVLRLQPMSMLRGTDARAAATGDLDCVSPRRLGHYLQTGRLLTAEAFLRLAEEVNAGVFPGTGRAFQTDALDFLAQSEGDVVYLDPPYPGTTSYEHEYAVLDRLLDGDRRPPSPFSSRTPPLDELLAVCQHIPVLILSAYSGFQSLDQLVAQVRHHRPVAIALELPYRHLASIASERRNAENREILIVASREGR